jgi:DNA-binding response OmpR family regulator
MKAKIMIVDDEEAVRQSLEDILQLEGYEVTSAASGDAALDIMQEQNFDLVLLDLKMPGLDGLDVMKTIRKNSPETKIVLLTGHGSMESAIEALRQGAHDYLLKPVASRELLNSVARAIAQRAEQQERRLLLEQLDSSIQRLKGVEGLESVPPVEQQLITLENGATIDLSRREIWRGNERVTLTPTEGKLMKVMLEHRGRVLTHEELVFLVQGYEASEWEAPEVLRPLVSRLRRKLSAFPNGEKWILNVRGTGYVLELPSVERTQEVEE